MGKIGCPDVMKGNNRQTFLGYTDLNLNYFFSH